MLEKIFQNRKPITIQSDTVTEFVNTTFQQYLKRKGVNFHMTHNPYKRALLLKVLINLKICNV